ncbi:MAG: DNA sulfur modification protein DndB [Potamolinea sp.]
MAQTNEITSDSTHSEPKPRLDALDSYFEEYHNKARCYPGLIFEQGTRRMLQINVPACDFPSLLRANPATANDPDSGKNRPEVKGHAEEIKEYLLDRTRKEEPWILGTLTTNVAENKIKLIEFSRGICLVAIPYGVKLDITDGQHRKRAIQELILSDESYLISGDVFPITVILEEDFSQCQIDFRDMAQTRQLDQSLLLSFGKFSGRVGITKNLQKRVQMFLDKTEKIKASPANKQGLIYTTNYIARFVSCAFANDPSDELQDYDVEESSVALVKCLNQFFSECNQTRSIFEKKLEKLKADEVSAFKEKGLLGMSVGLEILGRLLYFTYDVDINSFNEEQVSQLAQIDWSRENPLWKDNVVRIDPNPKNSTRVYKLSTGSNAVMDAVKMVKIRLGWT